MELRPAKWDRPTLVTRVKNAGAPKKTRYNYLGLSRQVAAEEQPDSGGNWEVSKTYNYGPDGRPLILIDTPVTGNGGASTHLYSYNAHGDTEALTSPSTGKTTSTYRYSAYGTTEKIGSTGTDAATVDPYGASATTDVLNPYRFNAMRFDPTSGKYDMGFRTYDPGLNRFLTRDAYGGALSDMALGMDPWNTNRYAFAGGNPVNGVELDGHRAAMGGEEVSTTSSGPVAPEPEGFFDTTFRPSTEGSNGGSGAGGSGDAATSGPAVWCDSSGDRCGTVAGFGSSPRQSTSDGGAAGEVGLAGCSWTPIIGWGCDAYDMKRTVEEDGVWSWSFLGSAAGFIPLGDVFKLPKQVDNISDAANGADNVANGVRLRAQLTGQEISGGHAFQKHVIDKAEFPGITTRSQFAAHIEDVVSNGVMRPLERGRSAYWQNGTVVIRDPNHVDGGTAFRPNDGYDYFLGLD